MKSVGGVTFNFFYYRLPHIKEEFLDRDADIDGKLLGLLLGRKLSQFLLPPS